MYEKYAEKYALDKEMQQWMKEVNPWALHRIAEVLLEAESVDYGMQKQKQNRLCRNCFYQWKVSWKNAVTNKKSLTIWLVYSLI